ncbi:GrpB family protein [Streptomyces sp. NP160]|uniref:GrpB family protein n=1 Tax=Streptomyces sp. NP160 TaxID=2586637 RepID=UPI0015D6168E|nr:GrpB family protein [Streptomyces sp. NP160]
MPGRALVRSEDVLPRALAALAGERLRLERSGVTGELRLVGGSSMPGLLTHGDVDLLLRVEPDAFQAVTDQLRRLHPPRREDLWTDQMSLFLVDTAVPVELAAVPVGSAQDAHFVGAWDRLAASAELRERYNALKVPADEDYEVRKAAFFADVAASP